MTILEVEIMYWNGSKLMCDYFNVMYYSNTTTILIHEKFAFFDMSTMRIFTKISQV